MENNKIILGFCPNFDKIVKAEFLEDDTISLQLVKIYRDFVFKIDINKKQDINMVMLIDKIMNKYVDDYFFRKTLQKELLNSKVAKKENEDALWVIVNTIIKIYENAEEEQTRKIYISRWI